MNYLPYLGNKSKFAPKIHSILGGRTKTKFIEPFAGSASVSLYMSQFVNDIYINELDRNIFAIHNSFKHGRFEQLNGIIEEIWKYGDPRENKEDYYNARTELNKKYFNSGTIEEGFYNWAISTFAINSMVRFGPSGFNQGWGNRGIGRNAPSKQMSELKFVVIQNCYSKIEIFNEDFVVFLKRFDGGTLFVDPPYVEMESGTYKFSKTKYSEFLRIIKEWNDSVVYTDVLSDERLKDLGDGWSYSVLRENIGTGKVGSKKNKEYKTEVVYHNFKLNTLW